MDRLGGVAVMSGNGTLSDIDPLAQGKYSRSKSTDRRPKNYTIGYYESSIREGDLGMMWDIAARKVEKL